MCGSGRRPGRLVSLQSVGLTGPCPPPGGVGRVGPVLLCYNHQELTSEAVEQATRENCVKVTAERVPESKVLLRIEVPPEQVEQAIEKTFRDLSRRVKIPGFRPGKAPRSLIEKYLGGMESVQREGVDRAIDDSFREALRETDTRPIGDPDISERPEFHPGDPLVYEATVPVGPRVELGDYASIRLQSPPAVDVTADQVTR